MMSQSIPDLLKKLTLYISLWLLFLLAISGLLVQETFVYLFGGHFKAMGPYL